MRLSAILFALLLTAVLPALDLTAEQLAEVAAKAKQVPVGASASMVLTKADGTRVVVAISRNEGATAIVIGSEVFAFRPQADGGFHLAQSGKPPVAYTAAGAVAAVQPTQPPAGQPQGQPQGRQQQEQQAATRAQGMYTYTADALLSTGSTQGALTVLTQGQATTTLLISNGTILSQATP